jgi:hypothetical protein
MWLRAWRIPTLGSATHGTGQRASAYFAVSAPECRAPRLAVRGPVRRSGRARSGIPVATTIRCTMQASARPDRRVCARRDRSYRLGLGPNDKTGRRPRSRWGPLAGRPSLSGLRRGAKRVAVRVAGDESGGSVHWVGSSSAVSHGGCDWGALDPHHSGRHWLSGAGRRRVRQALRAYV